MKYAIYGVYNKANHDIVSTLQDLGKVSRDLLLTEDARIFYKTALDGLYSIHGKEAINAQIAAVMTQLGGLSYCSGLLDDAKDYFEGSLAIKFKLYGENACNDDLASTLNNLGSLSARQKNHDKAFDYYRRALDQYNTLSRENDRLDDQEIKQHLARTLHNLGILSYNLQQYDEAKKFYAKSLKIKSQVYNEQEDSPDLALTLSKMSSVEIKQGHKDTAKYYQDQALKRSSTFLETHRDLINKDLLPASPEETAMLMSMIPPDAPDYKENEVLLRSLDLWQGLQGITSQDDHTRKCWYPGKGVRGKLKKAKF